MKKSAMILACVLVCAILFTGCADQKDDSNQDTDLGNSVEIDAAGIEVDAETATDAGDNSDIDSLPDGFTYSFIDPENSDGIVVVPRE